MGRLVLVRHAQASSLSQNYDQLSALGQTQARLLGEYWVRRNVIFDRVCTGPALRHRQTAQLVGEAHRKAGLDFPEPIIADEFDEFQADALLAQNLPQLLSKNNKIRDLHDAMQASSTEAAKRANFQRLFEVVVSMWVSRELASPNVESWEAFCARVNCGLSAFLAESRKGEVAVIFTSGGPVSVTVQRALNLSAEDTLRLAWMRETVRSANFYFPPSILCSVPLTRFPVWTANHY